MTTNINKVTKGPLEMAYEERIALFPKNTELRVIRRKARGDHKSGLWTKIDAVNVWLARCEEVSVQKHNIAYLVNACHIILNISRNWMSGGRTACNIRLDANLEDACRDRISSLMNDLEIKSLELYPIRLRAGLMMLWHEVLQSLLSDLVLILYSGVQPELDKHRNMLTVAGYIMKEYCLTPADEHVKTTYLKNDLQYRNIEYDLEVWWCNTSTGEKVLEIGVHDQVTNNKYVPSGYVRDLWEMLVVDKLRCLNNPWIKH